MSIIKPFRAIRPPKEYAEKVAGPPYDVLDSREAREMAAGNEMSFLHINKPEIDLPEDVSTYDKAVYAKGRENLEKFLAKGYLKKDEKPYFYIYRQQMGEHVQTGLVAGASVEEYEKDLIKKHELTRQVKEDDRLNHIKTLNAQTGPVFLTYPARKEIDALIDEFTSSHEPEYDFSHEDKFATVHHTFWVVDDEEVIKKLIELFAGIEYLYVADGHHRSASATRFKQMRQKENSAHTGEEEYNYFLSVIFPHNQMKILDYNRVVKDLNGMSKEQFIKNIEKNFTVEEISENSPYKPEKAHEFGMYLDKKWYKLTAKNEIVDDNDPIKRLDVYILQEYLLQPELNIGDPRKDTRIDFVGGIRGLAELEKRVNGGDWEVAFALFPTSIEDLMSIADAGEIMPPKSTWFEPKLRSGLAIHELD